MIKLSLAGKQHSEAVVDLGIVERCFQSAAEKLFGFVKGSLVAIVVSEVDQSGDLRGPQAQRFFKLANGVVSLTLLRGQHAKIVPGFRIVWAQLDCSFEVSPRFW